MKWNVSGQGFRALWQCVELQRKISRDVKALEVETKRINGKSQCEEFYQTLESEQSAMTKNIKFREEIINSTLHGKGKRGTTVVLFNTKNGSQNVIFGMAIFNHERSYIQFTNDAVASVLAHKKARTSEIFRIINNCLPTQIMGALTKLMMTNTDFGPTKIVYLVYIAKKHSKNYC